MARKNEYKPKMNLIGNKYGKLTVIDYAGYKEGKTGRIYHQWYCQCKCGNTKIVTSQNLLSGHCKSCGCIPHTPINQFKKHGLTNTKLYNVWKNMKGRCYTPSSTNYPHYGARGIKVCDEWKNDFKSFYDWCIKHGYKETESYNNLYTIDRMDVNGNYEPDNCRLTTSKKQYETKTNTVFRELDGIMYTTPELATKFNIPYKVLKGRLDNGETIEQAIQPRIRAKILLEYNGETHSIPEWSKITGLKEVTIRSRHKKGMSPKEIFETPIDISKWRKS